MLSAKAGRAAGGKTSGTKNEESPVIWKSLLVKMAGATCGGARLSLVARRPEPECSQAACVAQ